MNQAEIAEIEELMRRIRALRSSSKPRAVIIKGNPAYIKDNPRAEAFYEELKQLISEAGYEPTFDEGKPHTLPDESAALWVGHSRGIDRLRFAPPGVKTLAVDKFEEGYAEREAQNLRLMREAGYKSWADWPIDKRPQPTDAHYSVTDSLRKAIRAVSLENAEVRHAASDADPT